jgi:NADPH-dependent curcumin reductase CurA
MIARGAGVVIESRHPDFQPGDPVQSELGWREHALLDGHGLRKLPEDLQPLSLGLGMVGQAGATAMGPGTAPDGSNFVRRSPRVWQRLPRYSSTLLSGGNIGKQVVRLTARAD